MSDAAGFTAVEISGGDHDAAAVKPATKPKTMNSAAIYLSKTYCAAQGTSLGNSFRASKRIRKTLSNSTRNRLIASHCRYGPWSKLGECI